MSDTYRRLNRCGVDNCKTTLYYLEDGQWFCKNGHRREGELDIEEDDELNGQTQTGAKVKKPTIQEKEIPVRILLGRKGFELFLKCLQLILRKQVWILVHEKGFPVELEAIVRDLWALRLQKSLGTQKSSHAATDGGENPIIGTGKDSGGEASGVTDTETGYSSEYWASDVEIDAALAGENDPIQRKLLRRNKYGFRVPSLRQTLGMCYLGALLLRIPVSLGDMYKWAEAQELPFKLALREVPEKMQRLLHPTYLQIFQPRTELNRNRLQKTVQDLVILYSTQFQIIFPELNWPILAMKYIRDLGLPLETYHALKRLLHLHPSISTFIFPHLPKVQRLISEQPEPKLMSLLLLSTKLSWDIDGINRTPRNRAESASINPDGKSWEQFLAKNKFSGDSIFDYKDVDVMEMQDRELDAYMDWYEGIWLVRAGESGKQLPDHLLDMFPTSKPPSQHSASTFMQTNPPPSPSITTSSTLHHHLKENIINLNSTLHLKVPTTNFSYYSPQNSPNLRPGQNYPLWRPTSSLSPQANMLLEAAASVICLSREEMIIALRQVEVMVRDCEGLKGYKRRV